MKACLGTACVCVHVGVCVLTCVCLLEMTHECVHMLGVGGRRQLSVMTPGFEPGYLNITFSRKKELKQVWFW